MRRSGKIVRPVLRFVASVLITSGVLMLIDAGLTVTWQEPVSAFLAQRQQDRLDEELRGQAAQIGRDERALASIRDERERLRRLARLSRDRARRGHAIGTIRLPRPSRHFAVVEGTGTAALRKGPGHFPETSFPGEGGTVAIAGHRTTYLAPFNSNDKLRPGDDIVLDMPYGRFTYAVERTRIVSPNDISVIKRVPGPEQLVLSACHPLYSASHRIIVFARLRSASERPR
jgi:sortase A